jgi:hypothetical protein
MAAKMPIGTDSKRATITSQTVPSSAGSTPPVRMPSVGAVNRNSQEIAPPPLWIRVPRMISTGAINIRVIKPKSIR